MNAQIKENLNKKCSTIDKEYTNGINIVCLDNLPDTLSLDNSYYGYMAIFIFVRKF